MFHLLISIKFYVYSVLTAHTLIIFYMFPIIPITIGYLIYATSIGLFGIYCVHTWDELEREYEESENINVLDFLRH